MFEQVFDGFRKASESSLHMQQELMRQWSQQWTTVPTTPAPGTTEWGGNLHKRWIELSIELLNKQRESLDGIYRAGVRVLEQTLRVSDAKSPDEYRRVVEDVMQKVYETVRDQSETQLRELQKLAERSLEILHKA